MRNSLKEGEEEEQQQQSHSHIKPSSSVSEEGCCFLAARAACLTTAETGLTAAILEISSFHYKIVLSGRELRFA